MRHNKGGSFLSAVSNSIFSVDEDMPKRWLVFLLLFALFYVGEGYMLFYKSRVLVDERAATAVISAAAEGTGSSLRPLVFAALGAFGAFCWMIRPAGLRVSLHGWLPFLIATFIIYTCLSVTWADDPDLVMRRIVTFLLLCLAAFGIAHRFSNRDLMLFGLVVGLAGGVLGLGCEVVKGVFKPWEPEYRLYGIMHANTLGSMLAISFLAALGLARVTPKKRKRYLFLAAVTLVLLLLTKSRAALAGAVVAFWVWMLFGTSNRKRFFSMTLLTLALIGPLVVFILGDTLDDTIRTTVLLGRDSRSPETFTGRLPLWNFLISHYVADRPWFGYGFNGFWTPEHVMRVSAAEDWLILHPHSGYIGLILDLGYVGLFLFVSILLLAIRRSYAYFKASQDATWLFMTALLVWAVVNSAFDNLLLTATLRDFICTIALAKLALFNPSVVRAPQPAFA